MNVNCLFEFEHHFIVGNVHYTVKIEFTYYKSQNVN